MDDLEIIENLQDFGQTIVKNVRSVRLRKKLLEKRGKRKDLTPLKILEKRKIEIDVSCSALKFNVPGTPITKPKIILHN